MPANAFFPGGVLAMPGAAADKLLAQADGDAALLYLWLLRAAVCRLYQMLFIFRAQ